MAADAESPKSSTGFAPIVGADPTVLIPGSLPGVRSIEAGEYYAHARNAFWPIMRKLYGVEGGYAERCAQLTRHGVPAVWMRIFSRKQRNPMILQSSSRRTQASRELDSTAAKRRIYTDVSCCRSSTRPATHSSPYRRRARLTRRCRSTRSSRFGVACSQQTLRGRNDDWLHHIGYQRYREGSRLL